MAKRDILAVGTSAGGVEALFYLAKQLLYLAKQLPRDFAASVLVTIHLPGHALVARRRLERRRTVAGVVRR